MDSSLSPGRAAWCAVACYVTLLGGGAAFGQAQTPPASAQGTPRPALPITATTRSSDRVVLFASGCNHCLVTVNGKEVMKVTRDKAEKQRVTLKEGSVIAVKNTDRASDNSFWLSAISSDGEFLFETSPRWTSYQPGNTEKWWQIKSATKLQPAAPAVEGDEYIKLVKQSASTTPHYRGAQPIHATAITAPYVTYLYYVVTREDLTPKKTQ